MITTMTPHDANGLFIESDQLHQLLEQVFSQETTVIKKWVPLYQLYLSLCRLEGRFMDAARSLSTESFDTSRPFNKKPVACANASFSDVSERLVHVVHSLCPVIYRRCLDIGDDQLKAICWAHFHIKSDWYFSFPDVYDAGKLSDDGRILTRNILTLDRNAKNRVELDHRDVQLSQSYEIQDPIFQSMLEIRGCEVELTASRAREAIKRRFLAQCSMSDLVGPLAQ